VLVLAQRVTGDDFPTTVKSCDRPDYSVKALEPEVVKFISRGKSGIFSRVQRPSAIRWVGSATRKDERRGDSCESKLHQAI